MVKNKILLITGLVVVFFATMFLWLGKAPFIEPKANEPPVSPPPTAEPANPIPVGSPDVAPVPGDEDDSGDSSGDHTEIKRFPSDDLTEALAMTAAGPLELTVEGATGWAAVAMPLYNKADVESTVVTDFEAGQVFMIIEEQGDWWYIESSDGALGWVGHIGCLINLPDVIPSIVYDITNAYSARTRSSGYEIPGVTGQKLYDAFSFNERFLRNQFIAPSLYSTSKLLFAAQRIALEAGDTIIVHEAYRAHASQMRSLNLLRELIESNEEVDKAINEGPWSLNWFMATTMSNHQRGVAFDVSLGKVLSHDLMQLGEAYFIEVVFYEEYTMPTEIHELSPRAIALEKPVASRDRDAWREVPLAKTMTPGAIMLQKYFDEAGLTPIASEWWHFNDLDGAIVATELGIAGAFFVDGILSVMP